MNARFVFKALLAAFACAYSALTQVCDAVDLTWDHNADGTASDGAGTWTNANQWWDGAASATWTAGDNATIGSGGTGGTISLGGNVTAGTIGLNNFSGTYTIQGTAQTLTTNGGITIGADAGNVSFKGTAATTGLLTLNGTGGITMNGTGLLDLYTNIVLSYTGPTVINSGVVRINAGSKPTGNFTLNGGMLTDYYRQTGIFSSGLGTGNNQIQIYGNSGFGAGNGGSNWRIGAQNSTLTWGVANENSNASATGYFNPTVLKFRAPLADNSGASIYGQPTLQNRLDLNGGARTIDVYAKGTNPNDASSSFATIANGIQDTGGTGSLTKTGGGALLFGVNTSTWGGSTTVSAGRLDFGGTNLANIGGGSGRNITVAAGAVVRFNALSDSILSRLVETADEIGVMTGGTANNFDFSGSTGANLPNAFLGNWASNGAKAEISGTITAGSNGYKIGALGSNGLLGIRSVLSGDNSLTIGQTGASGLRINLVAANTFTGETVITAGNRLTLGNNLALQNSALNVGSAGGNFSLAAGTNSGRIVDETEASSPTFGGLIGSRNLISVFSASAGNNETNLAASAVTGFTLNVGTGNTYTYSGAIGGFGAGASGGTGGASTLTKTGDGTQILSGTSSYTGATTVSGGTLVVNGSISSSILTTVQSGGTIGGSGTVGALTIDSGGFINPGNSPGILNTGNYTQSGLYTAEINGLSAGTQHDQINVVGSVTITGGSLSTLFSGSYAESDLIFILLNDGADAISGTFSGLAQGSTVTSYGGYNWQISYSADSAGFGSFTGGNDIALMAVVIPEPGAALLGGIGLLMLLMRRSRR